MASRVLCICLTGVAVVLAIREGDPKPQEVAPAEPIPGSHTWWKINKISANSFACGGNRYCCVRGCKYLVETDSCGDCAGHTVKQKSPQEEIEIYQNTLRFLATSPRGNFRIPGGVDYYGPVRGCTKKNSVKCTEKAGGNPVCCCNSGFIFDFPSRECVVDAENLTNKEEPIPGSDKWGAYKGTKSYFGPVRRCAKDKKKWCCHRACQYDLEHDNCGLCKGYDEPAPPTPGEVIQKFVLDHGNYLIPSGIKSPGGATGICYTKHAKSCTAHNSTVKHCCCHQGFYWSFISRQCVSPATLAKEEAQEAEEPPEERTIDPVNAGTGTARGGSSAVVSRYDFSQPGADQDDGHAQSRSCSLVLLIMAALTGWP
ncbi:unnamed protein product [Durusdinium trenchii]|uniref:Uncharacterized protein n=1 Tax=Durusdinium trenchii TaxID=1381693 RepID=A0ABP0RZD8_9DINO